MTTAFDTMVAAHTLNEELPVGLLSVSGLELGVADWGKGRFDFGEGSTPPSPLFGPDGMGVYCARDVGYTHLLLEKQRFKLADRQDSAKLMKWLVLPGLDALTGMELNGIWVDMAKVGRRRTKMEGRKARMASRVKEYIPEDFRESADLDNDHFLRKWIFGDRPDGLGLEPITFTDKTNQPQVDEKVLAALRHPALDWLREYKKANKALSFFDQWVEWSDADHRLHPRFNPTGTVTGRRSCDKPNLMQVPRNKALRSCISAPPGWLFFEADYSAVEVRIAAWLAGEDVMLRLFADPRQDVYRYTASVIYKVAESTITKAQRQKAKAVVLGFLYGMSARGFVIYAHDQFHVDVSEEEAVEFRNTFFQTYPQFLVWHDRQRKLALKNRQVVSPYGRVRHLMSILSNEGRTRAKAERQAINSSVQGTGGDFTLASMVTLQEEMASGEECLLVGDIHDALLFQVREDVWEKWAQRILTVMERPPVLERFRVSVPIRMKADAKIGRAWGIGVEFGLDDFDEDRHVRSDWEGWGTYLQPEPENDWIEDDGELEEAA